jgi:hypothetical protein
VHGGGAHKKLGLRNEVLSYCAAQQIIYIALQHHEARRRSMATFLQKIDVSDQQSRNRSPSTAADEKMVKIARLIEGLQHLAQQLPLDDASITERDRVLLAALLNEGVTPCHAAKRVRRARDLLH